VTTAPESLQRQYESDQRPPQSRATSHPLTASRVSLHPALGSPDAPVRRTEQPSEPPSRGLAEGSDPKAIDDDGGCTLTGGDLNVRGASVENEDVVGASAVGGGDVDLGSVGHVASKPCFQEDVNQVSTRSFDFLNDALNKADIQIERLREERDRWRALLVDVIGELNAERKFRGWE
jgi:hypothetical protein